MKLIYNLFTEVIFGGKQLLKITQMYILFDFPELKNLWREIKKGKNDCDF